MYIHTREERGERERSAKTANRPLPPPPSAAAEARDVGRGRLRHMQARPRLSVTPRDVELLHATRTAQLR